ncbi:MAG: TolC family protein [Deltaproteobacteria bacterium]|nr:TolC family protein [Deltaproteobacteria bacterium]
MIARGFERISLLALAAASLFSVTARAQDGATEALPMASVSFDEAIRRALARNPNIELAQQEIRRSEAMVEQVRAAWLPSLNSGATYGRLDADRVFGERTLQFADSFNANLSASVPLIAPRAWVASARASEGVDLARLAREEARRQVALAATRSFLAVVAQQRVLDSAERALAAARAHEEFAHARLAGDVGNRVDAVRSAQERARSETRVQNQRIALVRAQEALGVVLGESGPVNAAQIALPQPPPLATALGETEVRRGDIRAARERVEINRRALRDTYADYLPTLTAGGQMFYQTPATPTVPTTGWQVQLVLSFPLVDGGNRYGRAHERRALESQSQTNLDASLRQARSEVRVAFEAMRRTDDALVHAQENATLAREALDLTEQAYRAGVRLNIEVIDAQRQSADAETELAIVEDAARQARVEVLVASGKFPVD